MINDNAFMFSLQNLSSRFMLSLQQVFKVMSHCRDAVVK